MTKIYIEAGGEIREVGVFKDGTLTSYRVKSKHLYKKLNAWGIDSKVLNGLVSDKGLHTVKIHDKETKTTYTTKAENFEKHGTILHFKPHRTQVFLPLEYWD